jgi:alpha-D-ribose 1-methylphosphonate 5-triphosphate synthase subunit PhnL
MTSAAVPTPEPTLAPETVLSVEGLEKSFTLHAVDGRTVEGLRGVDLLVRERSHVALAGLSGAGKSSLLKCINRTYVTGAGRILYRRAAGEVVALTELDDSAMAELRAAEIGYVSQFLRTEPRRSAHDVVARAAIRMGADPAEAHDLAAVTLRRLNIDERLWTTRPVLLSGGEKQRVNLAAGIVVAPRLLLLDEPVSALDPANRECVIEVVADLTARGASVVSVFHDLDAIRRLADEVVVLVGGKVVDQGTTDDVLDRGLDLEQELQPL